MTTQPSSELEAGSVSADAELLGSYALVTELASGHLTSVHRARPLDSGVSLARGPARFDDGAASLVIKRLHYRNVQELADRELLLAAGRAGMRVRSPHVVRVLAVHEDPEPFLVMEHIEGVSLSTLLSETLDQEVLRYVFPLLVDVLEGLEALHGQRDGTGASGALVHGAPCARHVLVGYDGVARLFDLTHATGPGFRVAARRSQRLHPAEMAPEQLLAPMHVDARCDLFIVGTVLYRALTGQPLFEHDDRDEALQQLLRKSILSPSEAGSPLGAHFDRICARALSRARADRYASAAEMARELKTEAQRASLYASREEIGSLVRMLALSTHEGGELPHELMHPDPSTSCSRADPHASSDAAGATRGEQASDDVLSQHHQGSSSFGFREAFPAPPPRAAAQPDPSVTTSAAAREAGADATLESGARESGAFREGLPSLFPNREEPRLAKPFWLWGLAAALALVGSLWIDHPPWRMQQRPGERPAAAATVRQDSPQPAAGASGSDSYVDYFAPPRSAVSSALPPRAQESALQDCKPSVPAQNAGEAHTVDVLAPAALRPKLRAKPLLDALPPNPY